MGTIGQSRKAGNTAVTACTEDEPMTTQSTDHSGILIVHLWIEGNPVEGFRARITQSLDSKDAEQAVATAAHPEDLYAVVRGWVESFVNRLEASL